MRFVAIQRIVGVLLVLSSLTMVPPALVSIFFRDGSLIAFVDSAVLLAGIGALAWWPVRNTRHELRLRDGFLVVATSWLVVGLCGALPLYVSQDPVLTMTDAVFESMSGLTTTGATVLTGIDDLPPAILYYRQQLQWIGGMGIIVLAVAILPMLKIGGMQLYRAETPGPMKDSKLTPRITETAKALWYIYLGLTSMCAFSYWVAGMSLFDAVTHAFSTVSIGGFSTHDLSLAWFDSGLIEGVAAVFMLLAGINFALHFMAWKQASKVPYLGDPELKAYFGILLVVCLVCTLALLLNGPHYGLFDAIRYGFFQGISAGTTTGFTTDAFYLWPAGLPLVLILASFVGGCAGSTGGGMKVIRVVLLYKQGMREIRRLIHPSAHFPVKMGDKSMHNRVIESVWGFFALYIACFGIMSMLLALSGIDLLTAVSAVAACLNNLGPALGEAGPHYGSVSDFGKWILTFAMLLGRLEVFTLLVLFTPTFWKD
ncbi:MAG: Trk system potassium uptake protein [Lysobacteraceae bacterium]|nr:MAG: Trk system potassium uptake protein [Xanthomonadaceae bacterium]